MKFVNFNQHQKTNTWIAWNKQYLQPLNVKITSLQDYMVYNYPEYIVFNSPNNNNPIDITTGRNQLQEDITWGKEQHISLFHPARLNWHQGFYNQSQYGDGVFVFPVDINNQIYYLINWYEDFSLPDYPYINRYGWKDKQWYEIPEYGIGGEFGEPSAFNDFILPSDALDFKSGYVCILNKQPIGVNNEWNTIKQSLDSYLIAPIGNGACYALNFFGNDLIAQYVPNDLDNFTNQMRINLGQNLRYVVSGDVYLKGTISFDQKGNSFALPNITINDNNKIIDLITDHIGNLWTGGDELVAQTVHSTSKEEIFIDVTYDTYTSQLKRNVIHNFNVSTTENIKTFNDEKMSMIQLQLF